MTYRQAQRAHHYYCNFVDVWGSFYFFIRPLLGAYVLWLRRRDLYHAIPAVTIHIVAMVYWVIARVILYLFARFVGHVCKVVITGQTCLTNFDGYIYWGSVRFRTPIWGRQCWEFLGVFEVHLLTTHVVCFLGVSFVSSLALWTWNAVYSVLGGVDWVVTCSSVKLICVVYLPQLSK